MNINNIDNRQNLLNQIDQALERMIQKGDDKTLSFLSLQSKRKAIANGVEYKITNIAPELIGGFGAMIATVNVWHGGRYAGDNVIQKGIEQGEKFKEENK